VHGVVCGRERRGAHGHAMGIAFSARLSWPGLDARDIRRPREQRPAAAATAVLFMLIP